MNLDVWVRFLPVTFAAFAVFFGCSSATNPTPSLPLPVIAEVDDTEFADEPSLAAVADGSLYVAWLSLQNGEDTLQVARYTRGPEGFARQGAWVADGGDGVAILGPKAVAADNRIFVVYAAERDDNWDIYVVDCGRDGPGDPIAVSAHAAVDMAPSAAYYAQNLYVAWEADRQGERHILFNVVTSGRSGVSERVSEAGDSNYAPAVAVGRSGQIAVAWHSWRDDNYDVYFRQRPPSGRWGLERRLTQSPAIDRNATLATYQDDVWIVFETSTVDGSATGTVASRKLVVAKVAPEGLQVPGEVPPAAIEGQARNAVATFDDGGRLWLATLLPGDTSESQWYVHLTGFTGNYWLSPLRVAPGKGPNRTPGLATLDGEAIVAFLNNDFPDSGAKRDPTLALRARNWVVLGAVDVSGVAPAPPFITLSDRRESEEGLDAGALRTAFGGDLPPSTITYDGNSLQLFYGDLHAHSTISSGNRPAGESLAEAYQTRRDIHRLDFVAITDHGFDFTPALWSRASKLVRTNEDPGRFLPFLAEEWTSGLAGDEPGTLQGAYGHRSLIFADPRLPDWWNAYNGQTPADVWSELRSRRIAFIDVPHQLADTEDAPVDWTFNDEEAEPVAEIYQNRGSYEALDGPRRATGAAAVPGNYLQDVWQLGIVTGVAASPGYGGGAAKTGVWARQLTREAILDGIRARHTFATTGPRLMLDVRVNGRLMGEKAPAPSGPVEVRVIANGPVAIERVEVIRSNQVIHTATPGGVSAEITYVDRQPLPGASYYYVRITQTDGEMAWSSPVWLGVR